jgi:hypothetical protein
VHVLAGSEVMPGLALLIRAPSGMGGETVT